MPRYRYQCRECQEIVIIFHGIEESYEDCELCEQKQTMKKLLSKPYISKKDTSTELNNKIGSITEKYIEAKREILEQQKEEGRKNDYEPT